MAEHGVFIGIEGGDGAGKATQTKILDAHMRKLGINVMKTTSPRYGELSAVYAEKYLNGDYGGPDEVPADLASLAFAIDRVAESPHIRAHLDNPDGVVVTDRYMGSNLAHQGTKFTNPEERREFYERTMQTEYEVLQIPRPNLNVVLLVPTDIAQANVDQKEARGYTTAKRDIHEADASHLDRAKRNYEELCGLFPDEFTPIICTDSDGVLRSIDDIQMEIRRLVSRATRLAL
jgi:dTMP kinase